MAEEFEIKDLGTLRYFLGMEVARSKEGISVSQRKYTLDLLQETGMTGCKLADTSIEVNSNLVNKFGKPVYASSYMRRMEVVTWILRYLKSTSGKGLMFRKYDRRCIEAYIDSDWAGSATDRKSISRYYTFVWGNLVTWRSKKQGVVARSSAEAEYRAMRVMTR
ncbi:uncharacterized mitochondrial protein AtMg00810-like [Benincasa hispida]|uniref:uncharacterized mitochondrial protein AtMg00810-like n=1 Tax=Benincasa hispida TaxID=102211 RepID=UPI0019028850|nr:uncharacterized mitochondrial protein AtMg00810-like [Benincasa hispida]